MKRHFTTVGRPPVEKKEGNCPHCNSRPDGKRYWACGSWGSRRIRQSQTCRIFQLEAEVARIQAPKAEPTEDDLARTEELYAFLQGNVPDGYRLIATEVPQLTADQAWTVVWYLANQYWKVHEHIERCDVCKGLFDTHCEGTCLDYGDDPYQFCDDCECGSEYEAKAAAEAAKEK